jgi:predicted amidohydrolase
MSEQASTRGPAAPVRLFQAIAMQTINNAVNGARTREEAMAIVHRSIDRWEELLGYAAGRPGAMPRVVVFPEFNLQGFPVTESTAEWIDKACLDIPGSAEIERLQRLAQKFGVYLGANAYERSADWPGMYFNCCFLIDPAGELILKYRRVSTEQGFSPHDVLERYLERHGIEGLWPVARTPLGNLAMMPCGEILWPETARCLMFRGAEVILHPTSDHGHSEFMAWESAKRTRAAENMVYLVSANAGGITGGPPSQHNAGNSKIIDFQGRILASSESPGESFRASAVIDVGLLRQARCTPGGPFGVNRLARLRPEAYAPLYAAAAFYPPNLWLDGPMNSKVRIQEELARVIERNVSAGTFVAPFE